MARSPRAIVEPAVLEWLRTAAGYSIEEAAQKVSTNPEKVRAWEKDEGRPSMPQLRRLSRIYKRPISDFFLPRPMQEPAIPHDFRRMPHEGSLPYSPALRHEIRLAYRRRTLALDLAEELKITVPRFEGCGSIAVTDDPEGIAGRIRVLLQVNSEEQSRWRDPRIGYNAWRERIESGAVLVFQIATVEKEQMLGFSLAFALLPVVAVNRKMRPNGRTFTMLHEFTHLLLGEGGVCDLDEDALRPPREQAVEVFCNAVAGAALVPMATLRAHELVRDARGPREWADELVDALSRHFCASNEVVLRRLLKAGLTTPAFYARKRAEYQTRMAKLEQAEKEQAAEGFARNVAQEAASNLGSFARLVLDGYQSDCRKNSNTRTKACVTG